MVTRGVNPFVDDVEGAAGTGGSFGLFEGDASGGDSSDDLDPEVADADPESFFDDDWDDDVAADEGFDDDVEDFAERDRRPIVVRGENQAFLTQQDPTADRFGVVTAIRQEAADEVRDRRFWHPDHWTIDRRGEKVLPTDY